MLPTNPESIDERFFKTLNEDIKLKPNQYGEWDMVFKDGDIVNVTGAESLANAIVILIMTRYGELTTNRLYKDDFGCKIHSVIKSNSTNLNEYKIEKFIEESLMKMRRIKKINYIDLTKIPKGYSVILNVTSINDDIITKRVELSNNE